MSEIKRVWLVTSWHRNEAHPDPPSALDGIYLSREGALAKAAKVMISYGWVDLLTSVEPNRNVSWTCKNGGVMVTRHKIDP